MEASQAFERLMMKELLDWFVWEVDWSYFLFAFLEMFPMSFIRNPDLTFVNFAFWDDDF